jgi:hypothetical protein
LAIKPLWLIVVRLERGGVMMRDPRCWREVMIRGGMTLLIAAICAFTLRVSPWIWVLPVGVSALVLLKWALRPPDDTDDDNAGKEN